MIRSGFSRSGCNANINTKNRYFGISQLNQVKNEYQSSVDFLSLYLLVSSYIWSTKFTGKNSIFSEELILMFVSAAILVPS